MFVLGVILGIAGVTAAEASGDKVGKISQSPVFSEDGQPAGLVVNVPEGCVIVPAQSQVVVWCPGGDN